MARPEDADDIAPDDNTQPDRPPLATSTPRTSRALSAASLNASVHEEDDAGPIRRVPSIRLRRNSATAPGSVGSDLPGLQQTHNAAVNDETPLGRPRAVSVPELVMRDFGRPQYTRHSTVAQTPMAMPRLTEEGPRPSMAEIARTLSSNSLPATQPPAGRLSVTPEESDGHALRRGFPGMRRLSRFLRPGQGGTSTPDLERPKQNANEDAEFNDSLIDWLDVFDPEIQTLSTLTNVQNSLFVPDLGGLVNRRPTYVLSDYEAGLRRPIAAAGPEAERVEEEEEKEEERPRLERLSSITSRLTVSHYAALPHGTTLDGWTEAQKLELEDRVRHMLHSRRSRFKRGLKGFGQYVRTPLGFFVTLYAVLITLFGLAWVLFLIGWIYVGDKQVYTIHIIDSVLVALFAIVGDGMAPLRAIDTYHLFFVVRYSRMIEKAKKSKSSDLEMAMRPLELPDGNETNPDTGIINHGAEQAQPQESVSPRSTSPGSLSPRSMSPKATVSRSTDNVNGETATIDGENLCKTKGRDHEAEAMALTPKQQKSFCHHQKKLAKSHSFYKPEETFTHYAFPLSYLIAVVVLLDCHSLLQISLGACTWGIDYHTRPAAITTVILCVSITCNITAGLTISMGDRKTRKKDVVALIDRQKLTAAAIKRVEKKKSR